MGLVAREEFSRRPHGQSAAWSLLTQLEQAHAQLTQEMKTIDSITRGNQPDDGSFAGARWQISQASLRKRTLVARIVDFLAARLDPDASLPVKGVRVADQQMLRMSAVHVRTWTLHAIQQDWDGYCVASREIRAHMGEQVRLEKQVLSPPLISLAQREIW